MTARKFPALDAFRLAAAVLVVTIHTSPLGGFAPLADLWLTRVLARVAVPFFLMVSGYFLARGGWRLGAFCRRTALVYLAAAALYLPLNLYAGMGPARWLRALVWDGTFYHLWYFPALLWGVPAARALARLGPRAGLAVAGALYLFGLGGDSWFGLADRLGPLHAAYAAVFRLVEYTRNGLFYAPLFLLLGAAAVGKETRIPPRAAAAGLALGLAAMTAEAFWLHALGAPRHDSMYLFLPLCMVCLFALLLRANGGRLRAARDASLLLYLLHPGCIVAVRGLARAAGLWDLLVANSLGHFAAVLALSALAAAALLRLRPLRRDPHARAWRELDAAALRHNAQVLRQAAGPGCALMAVVKADAYGHGARQVCRILQRAGVRDYAVACLAEGVALRRAGVRGRILVLGWTDPAQAPLLARWRLTQAVAGLEHGRALAAQGVPLQVQLALDTGMHRLGVPAGDRAALAELYALPGLRVTGVFSHLCVSDSLAPADAAYTRRQAESFAAAVAWLRQNGYDPGRVHLLASYGIWNWPGYAFDCVRAGIALYGVRSTAAPTRRTLDLRPVLAVRARVALVRTLAPGESAGYGLAFTAARPTRLAVLAIGYADGIPRCLAENGGHVLLHGVACPLAGRPCMDQLLADVTAVPDAAAGDVVTLIGRDGAAALPAEQVAAQCGTIANELLARLGARLPVLVLKNAENH